MKELKIEVNIKFCQLDELSAEELELIDHAIKATDHSYAKYSHFHVGAALRLEDDTIVIGANQENHPITPCGACRQVILEMEDRYQAPVRIMLYGTEGVYCINSVKDLLPLSFVDADMHG